MFVRLEGGGVGRENGGLRVYGLGICSKSGAPSEHPVSRGSLDAAPRRTRKRPRDRRLPRDGPGVEMGKMTPANEDNEGEPAYAVGNDGEAARCQRVGWWCQGPV